MNNPYTYIKVSLKAIADNFRVIKKTLKPDTAVMAVVKSDAYGHGIIKVSKALEKTGVDALGVAFVQEGVILREAGIKMPIYVLSGIQRGEEKALIRNRLIPLLYNAEQVGLLNSAASRMGLKINVHLKFDTGMARLGFVYDDIDIFDKLTPFLSNLYISGIATHLSDAHNSAYFTGLQIQRLKKIKERLEKRLSRKLTTHAANTAGLFNYSASHFDMVRPGISFYGYGAKGLTPAMHIFSGLISVKTLKKGYYVSYGRTYRLKQNTKIGVIPIGYADGYSRMLSNKGFVGINGKKVYIAGRVTMNHTMIDIDNMNVHIGKEVVIMGKNGSGFIGADDIAALTSTITYEVLCNLGTHIRRVYK